MLEQQIINVYSNLHSHIEYTNGNEISFNGSQIQNEFFKAWNSIDKYYKNKPSNTLNFL